MQNKKMHLEDYIAHTKNCLNAWNQADAGLVASFYTDDIEYYDPSLPQPIKNKAELVTYLKTVFRVWPSQKWTYHNLYPHAEEGSFTLDYEFQMSNGTTTIRGRGIDRTVFRGDKVCLDHVYLNAEKWNDWIIKELKGK